MASVNKVILVGNLTRDPESKTLESGTMVTNIGLATNKQWKDKSGETQKKVEYHNITVWGKLAEICDKFLTKGKQVYFEGELETQMWETEGGEKRYKTIIQAREMKMLGSKGDSDSTPVENGVPGDATPDELDF